MLAAMLTAVPVASGSPGPDPLAHAPRFARVLGQQALAQPAGVAVDPDGHLWVADTGHGRVAEFSSAGRMLAVFGVAGSSRERLNHPVALAVTPSSDVWVADQGNSRVVEFSAGGRYRVSFAVPTPAGVGLDARGDVWVSSPGYALAGGNSVREFTPAGHHRVQRGPVAQDPVHPDLRRERRAVRPRAPAGRAPRDARGVRGR